jgi:hypothetical protein
LIARAPPTSVEGDQLTLYTFQGRIALVFKKQ